MRVEDASGQRFYKLTDPQGEEVSYPSVTTVLSVLGKDLIPWALRECTAHIKKALPRGGTLTCAELDQVLAAGI